VPPPSVSRFEPPPPRKVRVFYSYVTEDGNHQKRLDAHLVTLKREGLIETWSSRDIRAGDEWRRTAHDALVRADLIVLLLSADFLASDYGYGTELGQAKERHDAGSVRVLPIRLKPADWGDLWIGTLDVLPGDGRPVTAWPDREAAWKHVAAAIREVVQEIADVLATRPG
jgi:internalin A